MTAREPLVLLHGITMSARAWDRVTPLLEPRHEVFAPTALGHNGGPPAQRRPARVADVIDDAERFLDSKGLERPHLAGNSLGGWIAVELARRGRARTVCALSPAGFWDGGERNQTVPARRLRAMMLGARLIGPAAPLLMRSGRFRHVALREASRHPARVPPEEALAGRRDVLGCAIARDLLASDEQIAPLDPLPCPVTLAWSRDDGVLPLAVNGAIARERLPAARFVELAGVGHVPMTDDPQLVAETILGATGA